MPRLKATERDLEDRRTKSIIRKYQELEGLSDPELAKRLGIGGSTLYSRMRDPSFMTLRELRILCKALDDHDRVELLGVR